MFSNSCKFLLWGYSFTKSETFANPSLAKIFLKASSSTVMLYSPPHLSRCWLFKLAPSFKYFSSKSSPFSETPLTSLLCLAFATEFHGSRLAFSPLPCARVTTLSALSASFKEKTVHGTLRFSVFQFASILVMLFIIDVGSPKSKSL